MGFKIVDYSELGKDDIAMTRAEWDKVRGLSDEDVMRVYWEGMVWTNGFPECLKGLPMEEQIDCYAVKENAEYSCSSYGEMDKTQLSSSGLIPLKAHERFKGVILKDGVVVGAIVSDYYGNSKYLYPGRSKCLYWSIDSDGTGSSSSDVYIHMYCLPFE